MRRTNITIGSIIVALLAAAAVGGDEEGLAVRDYQVDALISEVREPPLSGVGIAHGSYRDSDVWGAEEEGEYAVPAVHRFLEPDELVDLVREAVAPASWDEDGASVEASAGRLVVTARRDVQAAVAELLGALWAEASRRVRVDVRLVRLSPEALARLEKSRVANALLSGRLDDEQVKLLLAEATGVAAGSTVSRPARRTTVRQVNSVSYVRDFDVEIAQGSIVGDPIVGWAREGLLVDVRPHLLVGGDVFLEALAQSARLERPLRQANLEGDAMGTVDLPVCHVARFFTAGRVAPGESLAVVRRDASGAVHVTLLTPTVLGAAPSSGPVRFFPVSALLWRRTGYEVTDRNEEDEYPVPEARPPVPVPHTDGPGFLGRCELLELLAGRVLSAAREEEPLLRSSGSRVIVRAADPERVRGVAAELEALERLAVRGWRVHVRVFEETGPGKRKPLQTFHLDAPAGRRVCHAAGVERAYVADWDVEVAQESRIGDPIVGHAFGGATLNIRLDAAGQEGRVSARLEMLLSVLDPEIETRRTGNAVTGIIEIPRVSWVRLERELVLAPGETAVIDGGLGGEGRGLVIELALE